MLCLAQHGLVAVLIIQLILVSIVMLRHLFFLLVYAPILTVISVIEVSETHGLVPIFRPSSLNNPELFLQSKFIIDALKPVFVCFTEIIFVLQKEL